jgi:hypothetical protein
MTAIGLAVQAGDESIFKLLLSHLQSLLSDSSMSVFNYIRPPLAATTNNGWAGQEMRDELGGEAFEENQLPQGLEQAHGSYGLNKLMIGAARLGLHQAPRRNQS